MKKCTPEVQIGHARKTRTFYDDPFIGEIEDGSIITITFKDIGETARYRVSDLQIMPDGSAKFDIEKVKK